MSDHDHGHHDHRDHDHDEHDHDHGHHGDHDHENHDHGSGLTGRLRHFASELFGGHSHDAGDQVDAELEVSAQGRRALLISLFVLAGTAVLQGLVVALSGSVALLGDTLHNVADALTAVPLLIAFKLGGRPPTRKYTYGYGRAEDLAGVFVIAMITISSALAGFEAIRHLLHPHQVGLLWAVALAALIGFVGNETVARYRISVGRRIGSAALVADGLHARADGFTSLAVLLGVGGVALGWRWADPVVGLLITVAILGVLRSAARQVLARLMDAVEPGLVDQIEQVLAATTGVRKVDAVRVRWVGHSLHADAEILLDPGLSLAEAHLIAHHGEHDLLHAIPRLAGAIVHAGPDEADQDAHRLSEGHRK